MTIVIEIGGAYEFPPSKKTILSLGEIPSTYHLGAVHEPIIDIAGNFLLPKKIRIPIAIQIS